MTIEMDDRLNFNFTGHGGDGMNHAYDFSLGDGYGNGSCVRVDGNGHWHFGNEGFNVFMTDGDYFGGGFGDGYGDGNGRGMRDV